MTQVEQQTVTWYITNGNPWANTLQETAARLVRLKSGERLFAKPYWERGYDDFPSQWLWWSTNEEGYADHFHDEPLIDADSYSLVEAVSDLLQFPAVPE